jgi:MYXO-CTERM domain-containing protein
MRTLPLMWVAALGATAGFASSAWAQACQLDSDCADGQYCLYAPCAQPCDPNGGPCEPVDCSGTCVDSQPTFDQECSTNDDCDNGWVCEVVGGTACAGVACPDGETCPQPPPCDPQEIKACVPPPPAPCTSDADCGDGLVCVTYDTTACPPLAQPDCPPNTDCPPPEPVDCQSATQSYCVPAYFAPCQTSDDCGPGFDCVEGDICGCAAGGTGTVAPGDTGSGGTGSSGGGSAGGGDSGSGSTVPDCTCEPSGDLYCQLQDLPCTQNADCPDGFICQALPAPSVPCSYNADTGETVCDTPTTDNQSQCVPDGWDRWVGGAPAASGSDYDAAVGGSVGASDSSAEGRASDVQNPESPGMPSVQPAGGSGGSSSGGCQVGTGGSSGLDVALLAAVGLLLLGVRRRWL